MGYSEALNIMGLNGNFTGEELKKKYKELMRKWHPDVCKDPRATEMCKKINTARDVLLGKDKSSKSYHGYNDYSYDKSSNIDLNVKKRYYIAEVEKLFVGADMIGIDGEESNFAMFSLLFVRSKVLGKIEFGTSCLELENIFKEFKSDYLIKLYDYLYNYCSENCMSLEIVDSYNCIVDKKHTINIDRNVYEVYEALEKAKSKRPFYKKFLSKVKPMI